MLQLRLQPDRETVEWGGKLYGSVVLEGTHVAQVGHLEVSLEGISARPGIDAAFAPVSQVFHRNIRVTPGDPRWVSFTLQVPWRPLPSEQMRLNARAVYKERAPVVGGWSGEAVLTAHTHVRFQPGNDLKQLVGVVGEVTQTSFYAWREPPSGGVWAVLRPKDWQTRLLDAVTLEFDTRKRLPGGHLYKGRLALNLRERSASDHLKAALGLDVVRLDVSLRSGDPEGVRERLEERLRMYVNPARNLPVPSSSGGLEVASLPRPSSAPGPDERSQSRPHDDQETA